MVDVQDPEWRSCNNVIAQGLGIMHIAYHARQSMCKLSLCVVYKFSHHLAIRPAMTVALSQQ